MVCVRKETVIQEGADRKRAADRQEERRTAGIPETRSGTAQAEARRMERGTADRQEAADREELLERLRALAEWRNNDVVKLAFLEKEDTGQVDGLDLAGVAELKRNPNGTFEVKFVDKVRVLAMLRELLEERRDGALEEFMEALRQPEDGGEA